MSTNLDDLDKRLRPLAEALISQCAAAGCPVRVITTLRTAAAQQLAVDHGVSWTLKSKHLPHPPDGKSLAIDVCPESLLTQKNWAPANPLWWTVGAIVKSLGLRSGMDWNEKGLPPVGEVRPKWDPGHAELKTEIPFLPLS